MIRKILDKIESKRNSKRLVSKLLVLLKDLGWFLSYNLRKSLLHIWYGSMNNQKPAKIRGRKLKILYLYDIQDWAIHNVGKLWLSGIPFIEADFREFKTISRRYFDNYDIVWYGYLDLYLQKPFYPGKSVITLHDPSTLFFKTKAQHLLGMEFKLSKKNKREQRRRIRILRKTNIICISREFLEMLEKRKIEAHLIQTSSILPEIKKIKTDNCRICSIFKSYPRKNPELMNFLKNYAEKEFSVKFDIQEGFKCVPEKEQIRFLDSHEIYVCTSFEEGGPLPAMSAMKRGLVVVTTPVGQIQEFIENGKSGFICTSKEGFMDKIKLLSENPGLLHKMRIASRDAIAKSRNTEDIREDVSDFLSQFIDIPEIANKNSEKNSDGDLQKIFKNAYENKIWGRGSGIGSGQESTQTYRKFLEDFFKKYNIKSIVDAGCGDWRHSRLLDLRGINYTGIDIVPSVIKKNKKKYEKGNIKFYCKDITTSDLPKADLIIIKDVLQHLSNENILKVIGKIKKYRYALIINDFSTLNKDCMNGGHRSINLNSAPFNLNAKKIFAFSKKAVFFKEN